MNTLANQLIDASAILAQAYNAPAGGGIQSGTFPGQQQDSVYLIIIPILAVAVVALIILKLFQGKKGGEISGGKAGGFAGGFTVFGGLIALVILGAGAWHYLGSNAIRLPTSIQKSDPPANRNTLTRDDALRLINAKPKEGLWTDRIQFGELSNDSEQAPAENSIPSEVANARRFELERGLKFNRRSPGSAGEALKV